VPDRAPLGEFEHFVLAIALRLRSGYGAQLVRELEERTGRRVQGGALYVTLDRLEEKGYVVSRMGEPDVTRGGRPKRFIEVTPDGVRALAEHREALLRVWGGLESELDLKNI
jgi:PadR family transcriptional regulator PadR